MGVNLKLKKNLIYIYKTENLKKISITTKPYPGFPHRSAGPINGFNDPSCWSIKN